MFPGLATTSWRIAETPDWVPGSEEGDLEALASPEGVASPRTARAGAGGAAAEVASHQPSGKV